MPPATHPGPAAAPPDRARPPAGRADLVVLGAGPAGCGAAWRAAKAGHRVVLLEQADRTGGLAGSFELDGIRVDMGSHRLHPSADPKVLAALRTLLGDELQWRPRNGRIRLDGRWLRFPLHPADLALRLPPGFAVGGALDTLATPLRRSRGVTFADVLQAGLGPTMCRRFYFPYARKLWGVEPEELDAELARRRVQASSPTRLLRRALRWRQSGQPGFWYPRRGYGSITERLAEAAVDAGAEIRLGQAVTGIRPTRGGVLVERSGASPIAAGQVWSTVPVPALARLVQPPPPPAVRQAASELHFRAMVLVYLVVEGRPYTPYDAHYVPGSDTPVTRVSEPTNYRDSPDDPEDRTVLCAEIPCERGDDVWNADDETLRDLTVATLTGMQLPRPRVRTVHVRRIRQVYPVYHVGYAAALERLQQWVDDLPSLLTFGRQGSFAHDNTHHTLAMAWAAADALGQDGRLDQVAWAAARERFAAHVVED